MEVVEETAANKDHTQILKGKRTKRLRPQSPIPFSIVPPVSAFTDAEETVSVGSRDKNPVNMAGEDINSNSNNNNNNNVVCATNGVTSSSSASSSSDNVALTNNKSNNNNDNNINALDMSTTDEEDQDMAHCLILLAQGHSLVHQNHNHNHNHSQLQQQPQPLTIYNETVSNNNNNTYRFSSRRFLETSSSNGPNGGGKAGYYVYQCKTCDRTFPSFQALGGHRASHKKPKAIQAGEFKKNISEESYRYNSISTQSNNMNNSNNNNRGLVIYGKVGNKVHECGICGAEFTSGQALGGHMRRHRGAVVAAAAAAAANTALSLSPTPFDESDGQDNPAKRARSSVVSLDLDLNLPAPEDENRVNGSGFASKQDQEHEDEQQQQQQEGPQPQSQQQQQIQKQREELKTPLVLSAPTLVDCHY